MEKVKVGIIGCGNISGQYLKNAKTFPILDVTTLADIDVSRAQAKATEFGVPRACGVDELLKSKDVELVINLTIPAAHGPVALQCIEHGKHVIGEKPFAVTVEEGRRVLAAAKKKGLLVGCAPDTFMGAGHQTVRKLIDDGAIGRPVAATAYMMGRGHEGWHPDPEFFYKPGGGPMFDMGPYYLTDLIQILGPLKRVTGSTAIAIPERTVGSQPKFGQKIKVETPDHLTGTLEFANGCVGTIIMSFAVWNARNASPITIYGTEGTIQVPDPNGFDGEVKMWRQGDEGNEFRTVPLTHTTGYGRSVGAADMAYAIRTGRTHRANADLAFGVLEAMEGFLNAGRTGQAQTINSTFRPAALPTGLKLGELD